jgi:hypothetical protein
MRRVSARPKGVRSNRLDGPPLLRHIRIARIRPKGEARSDGTITKPIYRGFFARLLERQVRFSTVILLIF